MKKILFVSSAIVTSIVFGQSAFADTSLQLSKSDLLAASQGYILTNTAERPEPRRSALFAHIMDNQKESNTTLAKSKAILVTPES